MWVRGVIFGKWRQGVHLRQLLPNCLLYSDFIDHLLYCNNKKAKNIDNVHQKGKTISLKIAQMFYNF